MGEKGKAGEISLAVKFLVLLLALLLVATGVNIAWSRSVQHAQVERELHEKGQVLSLQMKSVWRFMTENQDRFELSSYSATGSYQGLHCALAGRTIGKLFTMESGYTTRYVNFNPRNSEDEPDEFEAAALNAFLADRSVTEYYGDAEYDGQRVFRYLSPMEVEEACLNCHGSPAGELDVTGHAKEGWQEGEIGGAVSIVIPVDLYTQAEDESVRNSVLFFVTLVGVVLVTVFFALSRLVTTPLSRVHGGMRRLQTGDLDVSLPPSTSSREVNALVSEFNAMTHELSDLYAGLEGQVRDRTAELARANDILEAQRAALKEANKQLTADNEYKSNFLAMMSHELRTPLTSIIAYSEMLQRDIGAGEQGEQADRERDLSQQIEANSRSLLLMVNDILEMSRLDAGRTQLELEAVDLYDLVGLVRDAVRPMARHGGVAFECTIDPHVPIVRGDFEKLRRVLENLTGNAMKFTPEGGSVRVHAAFDEGAHEVVVSVADTGIGIAPCDQERIFEKFVQVDSSVSRRYNGTGLGLPLAREYVEMHGGRLELESELGVGSTFTVRLPVEGPAAEDDDAGGTTSAGGTGSAADGGADDAPRGTSETEEA